MPFHSHGPQRRPRRRMLTVALLAAGAALYALTVQAQSSSGAPPRQTAKAGANPSEVSAGKAAFNQRCAICHYAESSAQKIGPGLKGIYARRQFADGKKVDDVGVTKWIESGGKNMPGFKETLKTNQIRALIAHLKTL